MVCSLHSVTTGSRDRANVSLIIINNNSIYSFNRDDADCVGRLIHLALEDDNIH